MSRRSIMRGLPSPPADWDASSRAVWVQLTQALELSEIFKKSRRTLPQFVVKGTVSVSVTFDANSANVTVATQVLAKLLLALDESDYVDVRQTV